MLSPSPTPYQQALDFLYGRINYERTAVPRKGLSLDRMRRLMSRLGDPQLRVPIIHVAGTKGKGSVSTMLASVLNAAGYRAGQYTSPHLEGLEERYVIGGQTCSEQQLTGLVEELMPAVDEFDREGDPPTFFELTTAMAFLHFAKEAADVAVLEVGMGGRLDSTNVCEPLLTVITSISFDHTKALGDTLEAIAGEKAGIIKPTVPVISGVLSPGARETIADVAQRNDSRLIQADRDFAWQPTTVNPTGLLYRSDANPFTDLGEIQLAMLGHHQAANAATVIAVAGEMQRLGWHIETNAVAKGLSTARCPARIEVIRRSPTIVLDAAHNPAASAALAETIKSHFPHRRRQLIFAIARDKDIRSVLEPLARVFEELTVTRFQSNPRGADPEQVAGVARDLPADWNVRAVENPLDALRIVSEGLAASELLCIAGSFFLAAELRRTLLNCQDLVPDPPNRQVP